MAGTDLISRQDALEIIDKMKEVYFDRKVILGKVYDQIKDMPSAEPNILDDGTLTITVQNGMLSKVNRVIVDEVGTKFCKMMYQDALPSAERKGKWIHNDEWVNTCSECGRGYSKAFLSDSWKYCPNCGARMEGEEE